MSQPLIRTRLFDTRILSFPVIIPGIIPVVLPLSIPIIVPLDMPLKIVKIDKLAEVVGLKNTSPRPVDLTGWTMKSMAGNRLHPLEGSIEPGQTRYFANMSGKKVWGSSRDDGALSDPGGQLVSYWNDC
jgi:hypothetical protein